MAYTYSGNPANNDTDWLRFAIGDTNVRQALLTDEELAALIAQWTTKESAVVPAYDAAILKASMMVDDRAGSAHTMWSQRVAQMRIMRPSLVERYGDPQMAGDQPVTIQLQRPVQMNIRGIWP